MRFCEHSSGCVYPVFGTDKLTGKGYCKRHQWSRTDTDKRSIGQKTMDKIKEKIKEGGNVSRETDEKSPLDIWFEERRKEMTGKCQLCGGKTEKDNDEIYRRSIHHLLPKRKSQFPSVSCHPDNFLEVCFYGNSCHSGLHNGQITWELLMDSKEWSIILPKLKKIYPFIAENEKRHLPELFLKHINNI